MKHNLPRVFAIGSFIGLMGAFVKWGWEVPFPPRNPHVGFPYEGNDWCGGLCCGFQCVSSCVGNNEK